MRKRCTTHRLPDLYSTTIPLHKYFSSKNLTAATALLVKTYKSAENSLNRTVDPKVEGSSPFGTYVNNNRIDPNDDGVALSHGDTISLGPSLISTYLFYAVSD